MLIPAGSLSILLFCSLFHMRDSSRKTKQTRTGRSRSLKRAKDEVEKPTVVFDNTRSDNISRVYDRVHSFHKSLLKRDGKPVIPGKANITRIYDRVHQKKRHTIKTLQGTKRQYVLDNGHHGHHSNMLHDDQLDLEHLFQSNAIHQQDNNGLEGEALQVAGFPIQAMHQPLDTQGHGLQFPLQFTASTGGHGHYGLDQHQGVSDSHVVSMISDGHNDGLNAIVPINDVSALIGHQSYTPLKELKESLHLAEHGDDAKTEIPVNEDSSALHEDNSALHQSLESMKSMPLGNPGALAETSDVIHIQQPAVHIDRPEAIYSHTNYHHHGHTHNELCHNGGVFVAMGPQEFQCICTDKYLGKLCNERNFCKPCPCKNGGKCYIIDKSPRYKCECQIGFFGYNCERRNPCSPNRCNNGGTCTHDGDIITCVCPPRFSGEFCDDIRNCEPNPCLNSGMCREKSGAGKFECDCPPEYKGSVCGKIRYCNSNPCKNGGDCHEEDNAFKCVCATPWQGETCERRVCVPNPCRNSGTCVEIADGEKFKCICQRWTTGSLCEEVRPCLLKPCINGGRCIDAYSGYNWLYGPLQYYCLCTPPYKGMNCEINPCKNCHEHAHCEIDHCVCDEGYEGNGIVCFQKPDPCHPNPCRNGGECIPQDESNYQCNCKKPFQQPNCEREDPCASNPCLHGDCLVQGDDFQCVCYDNWLGKLCDDKDPCRTNPCQNDGQCIAEGKPKVARCRCKGKWMPPLCKECHCPKRGIPGIPDPGCDKATGECICPPDYTMEGDQCIPPDVGGHGDPCKDQPCQNGGTCVPNPKQGSFTCQCIPAYYGNTCEFKRACTSNPCNNGGTCKEEKGRFVECECPKGFNKPFCNKDEIQQGFCERFENPCKNGGQCVTNGKSYDCICAIRYTGPNCGVDRCGNCDDNARCINGKCRCKPGFIGNGYECIRDSPPPGQGCNQCPAFSSCVSNNCQCNPGYNYVDNFCIPNQAQGGKRDSNARKKGKR